MILFTPSVNPVGFIPTADPRSGHFYHLLSPEATAASSWSLPLACLLSVPPSLGSHLNMSLFSLRFLVGISITHRIGFKVCAVACGAWHGLASACLSDPHLPLLSSWVSRLQPHWPLCIFWGMPRSFLLEVFILALPSACSALP